MLNPLICAYGLDTKNLTMWQKHSRCVAKNNWGIFLEEVPSSPEGFSNGGKNFATMFRYHGDELSPTIHKCKEFAL